MGAEIYAQCSAPQLRFGAVVICSYYPPYNGSSNKEEL